LLTWITGISFCRANASDFSFVGQFSYLKNGFSLREKNSTRHFGTSTYSSFWRENFRVVRGPDWKWADQDGGEGFTGTVVEICGTAAAPGAGKSPESTVILQWDTGARTNYRVGHQVALLSIYFSPNLRT
jgi:E3 ubiquitin-protein ligase mind-bomb